MNQKNILVIGENAVDKFKYFNVSRLSPEGPWPVLIFDHEIKNPGMAANVVSNLKSLKGKYDLNVHFLCQSTPIFKTRYVDLKTNHHFLRIDSGDVLPQIEILHSTEQLFNYCNSVNLNFKTLNGIVISSYKNFLTKSFIYDLSQLAKLHNIPIFMDCKFDLGDWSRDIFCIKINEKEYLDSDSKLKNPEKYCQNLIVTYGENGAKWINKNINFPLEKKVHALELSGAGDSFLSGLTIFYLETQDISESVRFANKVCAYKVSQKGIISVDRNIVDY